MYNSVTLCTCMCCARHLLTVGSNWSKFMTTRKSTAKEVCFLCYPNKFLRSWVCWLGVTMLPWWWATSKRTLRRGAAAILRRVQLTPYQVIWIHEVRESQNEDDCVHFLRGLVITNKELSVVLEACGLKVRIPVTRHYNLSIPSYGDWGLAWLPFATVKDVACSLVPVESKLDSDVHTTHGCLATATVSILSGSKRSFNTSIENLWMVIRKPGSFRDGGWRMMFTAASSVCLFWFLHVLPFAQRRGNLWLSAEMPSGGAPQTHAWLCWHLGSVLLLAMMVGGWGRLWSLDAYQSCSTVTGRLPTPTTWVGNDNSWTSITIYSLFTYCIARYIGGELNLVDWQFVSVPPNENLPITSR